MILRGLIASIQWAFGWRGLGVGHKAIEQGANPAHRAEGHAKPGHYADLARSFPVTDAGAERNYRIPANEAAFGEDVRIDRLHRAWLSDFNARVSELDRPVRHVDLLNPSSGNGS